MNGMETEAVTRNDPPRDDAEDRAEHGLRFSDPYWDDAFCAWWDPTLRTCC